MNIVNKVTLAQMKQNKRRTAVTIIGTIISVAMVTAVIAISVSFLDMMVRGNIASSGNWHAMFDIESQKSLDAIKEEERLESVALMKQLGFAVREGGDSPFQPYWYVRAYDRTGFENFPVSNLVEGRLPEREGEAVISVEALTYGDSKVKIGDTLELDIGTRKAYTDEGEESILGAYYGVRRDDNGELDEFLDVEHHETYTIVGIVERPFYEYSIMPGYSVIAYLDGNSAELELPLKAYGVMRHLNKGFFDDLKEICETADVESAESNNNLLLYSGVLVDSVRTTLHALTAIVMSIVVVGSISLIYNAFAISVSERSRYLGMLSSVGATARQKRNSVFFEGFVISCISIPLGIFFGYLGMAVTFRFLNTFLEDIFTENSQLIVVLKLSSILAIIVIALVIIFVSAFIPALRASRMSPIDAIRQVKDVKLTAKALKTSRLTRKIFGVEGEIALKNLKRNRRRYQATVFSLIISIVLFLSTGYFGRTLEQSYRMVDAEVNFDIRVSVSGQWANQTGSIFEEIKGMEHASQGSDVSYFYANMPDVKPADEGSNRLIVYSLDDEALRAYANQVGADYDRLNDEENLAAILINQITYRADDDRYVTGITMEAGRGDRIPVTVQDANVYQVEGEDGAVWSETFFLDEVEVLALNDQLPLGVIDTGEYRVIMIMSEKSFTELMESIGEGLEVWSRRELFFNSSNPRELQKEIENMPQYRGLNVYSMSQYREQQENLLTFMAVFVYGFVTLISAICVANIFNTISTSMMLRKREFAMLRSTGMTPESFSRMIRYESMFYGVKALLYGLPISFAIMGAIFKAYTGNFEFAFLVPWGHVAVAVAAVFFFVGITMVYSTSKIKRENIIDSLKQEAV